MLDDGIPHIRAAADHQIDDPSGIPASSSTSTNRTAMRGVNEAGLKTTVLPAISAGVIFHDGIAIGKFQG